MTPQMGDGFPYFRNPTFHGHEIRQSTQTRGRRARRLQRAALAAPARPCILPHLLTVKSGIPEFWTSPTPPSEASFCDEAAVARLTYLGPILGKGTPGVIFPWNLGEYISQLLELQSSRARGAVEL